GDDDDGWEIVVVGGEHAGGLVVFASWAGKGGDALRQQSITHAQVTHFLASGGRLAQFVEVGDVGRGPVSTGLQDPSVQGVIVKWDRLRRATRMRYNSVDHGGQAKRGELDSPVRARDLFTDRVVAVADQH